MRKAKWEKVVFVFVLVTLVCSIVYAAICMDAAPEFLAEGEPYHKLKSDYLLMIAQCVLGIIAIFLPSYICKKLKIKIMHSMHILFFVFLYCAIFLGEVRNYYYNVPHWDTLLHTFSGGMLGALGISVINILNKSDKIAMNMSPLFIAIFGFCFAVSLGALWEIYEYTFDGILKLNMQKFISSDNTVLVGREALADTMKDITVDVLGAFSMSLLGFFIIKYDKNRFQDIVMKRVSDSNYDAGQ